MKSKLFVGFFIGLLLLGLSGVAGAARRKKKNQKTLDITFLSNLP